MTWCKPWTDDTVSEVRVAEFYQREARRREFLAEWGRLVDWLDDQRENPDLPAFAKLGGEGAPGYTLRQIDAARATLDIMARAFTPGVSIEDLDARHRRRVAEKGKRYGQSAKGKARNRRYHASEGAKARRKMRSRIRRGAATAEDYTGLGREVPADLEAENERRKIEDRALQRERYRKRVARKCACDDPACPHCRPSSNGCSH